MKISSSDIQDPEPKRGFLTLRWLGAISLILAGAVLIFVSHVFLETPSADRAPVLVWQQAKLHGVNIPASPPPRRFVKALVATEDHRFFSPFDPGIDPLAVARAVLGMALGWRDQGGSTIEQQLAKLLYAQRNHGIFAKLEQVALAVKLDFAYTKPKILGMYGATVYFGSGYYGIENASCGYFGKPPSVLDWGQSAMLAGILNAPSVDNPRANLRAAKVRERHVLTRLVATGDLTHKQAEAVLAGSLGLLPATPGKPRNSCASAD